MTFSKMSLFVYCLKMLHSEMWKIIFHCLHAWQSHWVVVFALLDIINQSTDYSICSISHFVAISFNKFISNRSNSLSLCAHSMLLVNFFLFIFHKRQLLMLLCAGIVQIIKLKIALHPYHFIFLFGSPNSFSTPFENEWLI